MMQLQLALLIVGIGTLWKIFQYVADKAARDRARHYATTCGCDIDSQCMAAHRPARWRETPREHP